MEVSLHALTGIRSNCTMQLQVTIAGERLVALVDSGSTHMFMAEGTARRLGLTLAPRQGMSVAVANGDRVTCAGLCSGMRPTVDEEDFSIDCYAIPLDGFELVLGVQWLRTVDFELLSMSFWQTDHRVIWQGVDAALAMARAHHAWARPARRAAV